MAGRPLRLLNARRQGQVGRDLSAVGSCVRHRLLRRELHVVQLRAHLQARPQVSVPAVEHVEGSRIDIGPGEHHHLLLVLAGIDDVRPRMQCLRKRLVHLLDIGREIDDVEVVAHVAGAYHTVPSADGHQSPHVHRGAGVAQLLLQCPVQGDRVDRQAAIELLETVGNVEIGVHGFRAEPLFARGVSAAERLELRRTGHVVLVTNRPGRLATAVDAANADDAHVATAIGDVLPRVPARFLDRVGLQVAGIDLIDAESLLGAGDECPGVIVRAVQPRHEHRAVLVR